jgi:hypothetical protein
MRDTPARPSTPFRKMLKFSFDGYTSFSTVPLKLATWLGSATAILAVLYLLSVFVPETARLHGRGLGDDHGGHSVHRQRAADLPRHPR